jgi:glycosyltransferase
MDKFIVDMINLYIFNESSKAAVYGIGTYIKELAVALKESDINVCIVYLRSDKKEVELDESNEICHLHIPASIHKNTSLNWDKQSELYYQNVVYLLQLHIKTCNRLVFHLNFNQSRKLAERLKEVFDCKIVFAVHCLNWCFSLSGNVSRFRELLSNFGNTEITGYEEEKKIIETADKVICLSEITQEILQNDYNTKSAKISVIYNGLKDSKNQGGKKMIRKKHRIPLNAPVILFVGRLDAIKGLNYLISAFNEVLAIVPRSRLIIVGNGSYDIYLKECKNNWMQIHFTGKLDKEKLYELYSIADIGVMPSFHEQCSYVAIEMMMHGIPLIASNSTGLKEMIEDGVTGLHVPVIEYSEKVEIDSDELARNLLYLLQHPAERKRMGKNARKRYETVYSANIFREKMLKVYRTLFVCREG